MRRHGITFIIFLSEGHNQNLILRKLDNQIEVHSQNKWPVILKYQDHKNQGKTEELFSE